MQDYFLKIWEKFCLFWRNYLLQSALAAATILVIFLFLTQDHAVIIASIGATAFITFAMPKALTARPQKVILGHIIGLTSGSLCALIPQETYFVTLLVYSLAVGISIFLMVSLDLEHPPAAGTALGVSMTGFSFHMASIVVASVLLLSFANVTFKKYLKDLT